MKALMCELILQAHLNSFGACTELKPGAIETILMLLWSLEFSPHSV